MLKSNSLLRWKNDNLQINSIVYVKNMKSPAKDNILKFKRYVNDKIIVYKQEIIIHLMAAILSCMGVVCINNNYFNKLEALC